MSLVDFKAFRYVPIISVRPSEMTALEESLPADKDHIIPYIILQPWVASNEFDNTLVKVEAAVGHRPVIVDITEAPAPHTRRPVHDTIDALRNSESGYRNWCEFVEQHQNYIPAIQLADPAQLRNQIEVIRSLDRGAVVRVTERMLPFAREIARLFRGTRDQAGLLFVVDFQRQNRELLNKAAVAVEVGELILSELPAARFSASASTFPESFVDLTEQEIFERRLFELIADHISDSGLVYSDHASVRAEREGRSGGSPAPRIDNAAPNSWHFFRKADQEDRAVAYQIAASAATAAASWRDLGIWGTEQIKNTADGEGAIGSPARSTGARINIHLHTQANYGGGPAEAETSWSD